MLSRIFRDDVDNKQANRKRQIDTLKVFNDNVTELKENAEYKVEFLAGDQPMCLYVSLPAEFPSEKPAIRVQPPIQHQWVNSNSEIDSAPGLLNYTAHSDLGRIVNAIIREFQIHPPSYLGRNTDVSPVRLDGTKAVNPNLINMPSTSGIPQLATMNPDELKSLNDDPQRLNDFVMSLKQAEEMSQMVEARIATIECQAEENLRKQELLSTLRGNVSGRVQQAQLLKASFDDKNKQYVALSEQYQPESIREALRAAMLDCDEEAEQIADRFLNGQMDVDQFLLEYVEKRKQCQTRRTKEEKLSNQLSRLKRAGY